MLTYALKSALTLALLYSGFLALLSRETLHRLNRLLLVACMVTSLVVPFIHVTVERPIVPIASFPAPEVAAIAPTPSYSQTIEAPSLTETGTITLTEAADTVGASDIYLLGVVLMLAYLVFRTLALVRLMQGGLRHTDNRGNTVILKNGDIPPFSIFHYIVMSVGDYENHRHAILTHEQEHIRLRHTLDLLLFESVKTIQWFNPFVWLLGRDLAAVHEYEADEAVVNQGIDAKQYQQLLVMKAVGNRLQPFANNLRRGSLKQRINMMQRKKSNPWHALRALFAIPVAALAVYAFATPATTNSPEQESLQQALQPGAIRIDLRGAVMPVSSTLVTNNFGVVGSHIHKGIDIKVKTGDKVRAALSGKVVKVEYEPKSYGKYVIIDHSDGLETLYAHLSEQLVAGGQTVEAGEAIGLGGNTGRSTGPHLHFETRLGGSAIDPAWMFDFKHQKVVGDSYTFVADTCAIEGEIYTVCEELPRYKGGDAALMQLLAKNIQYPQSAMDMGITGRVMVKFVVEKDGTVTQPQVAKYSAELETLLNKKIDNGDTPERAEYEKQKAGAEALSTEAIRVVRLSSGQWTPGRQRGKPVRAWFTLPVTFRLN